jgi:hypothetical protein
MVLKSKQVLTATLVIALGAALAVNWYYRNTPELSGKTTTEQIEQVSGNLGDSLYVAGTTAPESGNSTTTLSSQDAEGYFAQAKLKRTQSKDEMLDEINKIAESEKMDENTKSKLLNMIEAYKSDYKVEVDCENLITAKTQKQCLVVINNDKCQVILEKNTLDDLVILQISEIIEKNTEISSENLTIIELK